VRWYVITFPSGFGANVQSGVTRTASTADNQLNITVNAVNLTRSFSYFGHATCTGSGGAYPRPFWTNYLFNSTNLRVDRGYAGQNSDIPWQIITWPQNKPPVIAKVTLNSTSGNNLAADNLTRYVINATDADGEPIKNITTWYLNGTSMMLLNMPFEANNGDETTTTKDYSKPQFNGTINSATWDKTGGYDGFGAYEFGGDGDNIFVNKTCDGITEVTVTAWVKSDVTNTDKGIWIGRQPDGSDTVCGLRYDASGASGGGTNLMKTGFTVDTGVSNVTIQLEASNNSQTTEWQFLAVTWKSGEQVELYIDGIKDTPTYQDPAQNGSISGTTGVRIGLGAKDTGATGWDGMIDEFVVYDRKLSDEQILALYHNRTDLIVSQETNIGDEWQACVTPNDGFQDGYEVCSNNITIIAEAPKVYPDSGLTGATYLLNETAILRANVTGLFAIDTVYANVTLPNGTKIRVDLNNTGGDTYEANFTNLNLRGRYNITFFANDTQGGVNDSQTSYFTRISLNIVDLINGSLDNNYYIDYTVAVLQNSSGILNLSVTVNSTMITQIIIYNYPENSADSTIRLQSGISEESGVYGDDGWAIDFADLNFTTANVTAYAGGDYLLKCTNFSWTTLQCAEEDEYEFVQSVQSGSYYTIILDSIDPSFVTTITGPASTNDSQIRQNRATTNYGAATTMRIGRGGGGTANFRPIIRFNLTGIPENATIINATLQLYFHRIPPADTSWRQQCNKNVHNP